MTRTTPPVLSVQSVTKQFGNVIALADVNLDVHAGEVVALVGDNAAGKSTLAKIISGVLQPDSGVIAIDGDLVTIPSPSSARALGIATVFQHYALCENLSVVENLYLGQELVKTGHGTPGAPLDNARMEDEARRTLAALTSRIPSVRTPVAELTAGQRQAVAIARTLLGSPRVVVLDEPTASLSVAQTAEVLTHVGRLRDLGHAVILISHNMSDVRSVADRIEVLRHGRNKGAFPARTASHETILAAITGAL